MFLIIWLCSASIHLESSPSFALQVLYTTVVYIFEFWTFQNLGSFLVYQLLISCMQNIFQRVFCGSDIKA